MYMETITVQCQIFLYIEVLKRKLSNNLYNSIGIIRLKRLICYLPKASFAQNFVKSKIIRREFPSGGRRGFASWRLQRGPIFIPDLFIPLSLLI